MYDTCAEQYWETLISLLRRNCQHSSLLFCVYLNRNMFLCHFKSFTCSMCSHTSKKRTPLHCEIISKAQNQCKVAYANSLTCVFSYRIILSQICAWVSVYLGKETKKKKKKMQSWYIYISDSLNWNFTGFTHLETSNTASRCFKFESYFIFRHTYCFCIGVIFCSCCHWVSVLLPFKSLLFAFSSFMRKHQLPLPACHLHTAFHVQGFFFSFSRA